MESAGFAIGVAGLLGVFPACVDCFECIQIGRQFGQDYGKCLLQLDTAKLRMSRWGVAIGLGPGTNLKQKISVSDEELILAQSLLEQILISFMDAERISERFKKHTSTSMQNAGSEQLLVHNASTDLDLDHQRLHVTMRELAFKRQKGTSFRKKAAWALYEKKRFDRMIEDVTGFINELVDLFPAAQEDQKALCKAEVAEICETQDLALLNHVCECDRMLAAEVEKEMKSRGHSVTDWKAGGNSKMWAGDENAFRVNSKGHSFARFTVSDYADVRLGNMNRGEWLESCPASVKH